MAILITLIGNILGLYLADRFVPGFVVHGNWQGYLIAGVILALLNLILKPLLKLIAFPVIVITLGLFLLIINAIILWLAAQFAPAYISIATTVALLEATLIIAVVNFVAHWI